MNAEVMEPLALWAVDAETPLVAMLAYSSEQPYDASLAYVTTSGGHVHTFDRGILADALLPDAPEVLADGDIQIAQPTSPDHVLFRLWHEQHAVGVGEWLELYADRTRLDEIVTRMYEVVPMGREHEYLDAEIAELLRGVA